MFEAARDLGIPGSIISKAPSAGLWQGQKDEDEIGIPYSEIDDALESLERNGWLAKTPVEEKVLALVKKSEHKRKTQSLL